MNTLQNSVISTHNMDAPNFLGAPSVNTAFFEPTTPDEVYSAFISLKNSKARDIDGLQIKPIKFAMDFIVPTFTHVFNVWLSTGVYPTKMQLAKVTAVFEAGDRNHMSYYRPVPVLPNAVCRILSVNTKGLENAVCKRVVSFCEKHQLLPPHQFGFRRTRRAFCVNRALALSTKKNLILNGYEEQKNYIRRIY